VVDEDKLEHWELRTEKAARALKTAMSQKIQVLTQDYKDDPVLIWMLIIIGPQITKVKACDH
jgi:hypothetical protein